MNRFPRTYFQRPALQVARDLLGSVMIYRSLNMEFRVRIVETEAYTGVHDLACHAAKGKTARTQVLFEPGGCTYLYFIYGMHWMFNVVTGKRGQGQAVLIRAAECLSPHAMDLSGPGKFTKHLGLDSRHNALSLAGPGLFFIEGSSPKDIIRAKRVGVDYAGDWKDKLFRFYDASSSAVSKR
jgi:DNA-3-methyladenine glycosylase